MELVGLLIGVAGLLLAIRSYRQRGFHKPHSLNVGLVGKDGVFFPLEPPTFEALVLGIPFRPSASGYCISIPFALVVPDGARPRRRVFLGVGPSPARGDVVVRFSMPERREVRVGVYDAAGRLIRVLGEGLRQQGDHALTWTGRDESGVRVASGVYFVRLTDERSTETRKVVMRR